VSKVKGIRKKYFFYQFRDNNQLLAKALSCRCHPCLRGEWDKCEDLTNSDYETFTMTSQAAVGIAAQNKSRSRVAVVSNTRRMLARTAEKDEIVALESQGDEQGHSFWLASVEEKAREFKSGDKPCEASVERGVTFKKGNWYIRVRNLNNFPVDSSDSFKLGTKEEDVWTINAEAVIARQVVLANSRLRQNVSSKSNTLRHLSGTELARLEAAAHECRLN